MNRVEELTLKLADEAIDETELTELRQLVVADDDARRRHVQVLEIEAALRGGYAGVDVTDAVMGAIKQRVEERIEEGVMKSVRRLAPTQVWGTRAGGRKPSFLPLIKQRRTWTVTALAACALLGLGLLIRFQFQHLTPQATGQSADIRIQGIQRGVRVGRGDLQIPVFEGRALQAGETVATLEETSRATIVYKDGSQLELAGIAEVMIEPESIGSFLSGRGRSVLIQRGVSEIYVSPQGVSAKMAVLTPHAMLEVVGTRFKVAVEQRLTRVDVREGRVRATSRATSETVSLEPGRAGLFDTRIRLLGGMPADRSGGGRIRDGLLVLYTFTEGSGRRIHDVSKTEPPVHLKLLGDDFAWREGGGLIFPNPSHRTIATSVTPRAKLYGPCVESGELTIEAWIETASVRQPGPPRIFVYDDPRGEDANACNWAVAQANWENFGPGRISFRLQTAHPRLTQLNTETRPIQKPHSRYHLVCTFSPGAGRAIYVNGVIVGTELEFVDFRHSELQNTWKPDHILSIGNRTRSLDRPWQGTIFLAAVYSHALDIDEIRRNYEAGLPKMPVKQAAAEAAQPAP